MAEQGLPTTTETTGEIKKQYIRIYLDENETSNNYLEIRVNLKEKIASASETTYTNAVENIDFINAFNYAIDNLDPNSLGYIQDTSLVRFRFERRRKNGFKLRTDYNSNNGRYFITFLYDGGRKKETFEKLIEKLSEVNAQFNDDNGFPLPFTLDYHYWGSGVLDNVPWKGGIDVGEKHLNTKTLINDEETVEVVDDSFYTVESNYYSVEDPDGVSSTFADLQKDICIKEPVVDEFGSFSNPDLKRICPTCIPNPSHTPLTWYEEPGVWLNEKTCNYTVRIKSEEPYSLIKDNPQRKERYIRKGITGILSYLNKQVIDQDICWNPPENASEECAPRISQNIINQYIEIYEVPTGENDGATFTVYRMNPSIFDDYQIRNPIALELFAKSTDIRPVSFDAPGVMSQGSKSYIKITVPANLIDLIPEDLLAQESEEAQEDLQDVEEVILEGPKIKRSFKKVLPQLFESYSEYQSFYKNVEGGHVRIATDFDPETPESKVFYFIKYKKQFKQFYSDLKQLLSDNNYKLYSDEYGSSSSFKSNSKYIGGLTQKLAASGQKFREAVEVKILFDKSDPNNPFKIASVKAKYEGCPFYRCGAGLRDFIEKYNKRSTLMAYVSKSNDMMYDIENSKQIPPWRDFAVDYTSPELTFVSGDPDGNPDAESCLDDQENILSDLILDAQLSFTKAAEYMFNSLNCRDFSKYDPEEYRKIMGGLKNGSLSPAISTFAQDEQKAYNKALQQYDDYYTSMTDPNSAVAKFYKKLQKPNKEKTFFERLSGKTIEEAMANLKNKESRKEFAGEVLDKINPCNWEAITFDIIKCLLKGLNPTEALQTAAKSLLKSQNPEDWEKIFVGLTEEQQAKIKKEIKDNFGDLPTPWEFKKEQTAKGVVKINDYESQRQPPQNPGDLTQAENSQLMNNLSDYDDELLQMESQLEDLNAAFNNSSPIIGELFNNSMDDSLTQEQIDFNEKEFISTLEATNEEFFGNLSLPPTGNTYNDILAAYGNLENNIATLKVAIDEGRAGKAKYTGDAIANLEDDRFRNDVNAYEKAVQNVLKSLLEAYTQALINSFGTEELRKLIDSIPGSEIFATILATASCPTSSKLDKYLDDVIGGIELNPCMGKNGWYFPEIPELPGFSWLEILKFMLLKFVEEIVTRIFAALTKYLLKLLQKLLSRVCDILSGLGRSLLGKDDTGILDAVADAFCNPDRFTPFGETQEDAGIKDDAINTLNDFVYRYSMKTLDKDPTIEWATAVSENINSYQFLNIFVQGVDQSDPLFATIWEATKETQMSEILKSEDDLEELLNLISSYLTDTQRGDILGLLENQYQEFGESEDGELNYAEFCKKYFCLEVKTGFNDGEDPDGLRTDLEDIFDSFLNGPEEDFQDILDEISLDPGGDPFCQDLNDPDDPVEIKGTKGITPQLPPELREFQKALSDSVFADLESAYISDTIENKHSFFNNVLADQDNIPLVRGSISSHENRVERTILFPNASNTIEDHKDKYDNARNLLRRIMHLFDFKDDGVSISKEDGDYPTPTNLFPETVGRWLQFQTLRFSSVANFKTKIYLEEETVSITSKKEWRRLGFTSNSIKSTKRFKQKPDLTLPYRDNNGGEGLGFTWGFDLNYNSVYLEESPDGNASYDTVNDPSYEIELIEYVTTAPPSSFKEALLKLLPAPVQDGFEIDEELLLRIKVPINLSDFQDVYEENKGQEIKQGIYKGSPPDKSSHQEEAFRNFLLNKPEIKVIMQSGQKFAENYGLEKTLPEASFTPAGGLGGARSLPNRLYGKMKDLFAKRLISGMYSASKSGESNSFLFGYTKDSEVNYQDLLYVNPTADPSNSATWKYSFKEEDKVMGKSATENPRVVFLDPEIYGGSYKKPKIYIHPHPYKGWLGIMQSFNPEIDGCSPKKSGWLFLSEVSERVSKLENSLKKDKRLEYDPNCVKKAPYDLIADSSTHAYLDGIVISTIRTYIIETILRTMPTLSSVRFNSQNYDTGMGLFLINRMKEEMKDFPKKRNSGLISKLRYWYLFLEQMVQTVERRIITGEIQKDEELDSLFQQILEVRANYYYPTKKDRKILKRITKVSWNNNGTVDYILYDYGQGAVTTLREGDPLFSKLSRFIDAISFNGFGPSFREVLKGITEFDFKARKIKLKELRMYTKIYDIYLSENLATNISSRLVLGEFNAYQYKIQKYLPEEPYIQDLSKFILNPKSGLTIGPPINVGTIDGEREDSIPKGLYGDVISVTDDPENDHPLDKLSQYMSDVQKKTLKVNGAFYLEKYVVVTSKPEVLFSNQSFQDNFLEIDRKPISTEKFREIFVRFQQETRFSNTGDLFVSDLFGNAVRDPDNETYEGSIGIKFGVRLSYLPPEGFDPSVEQSSGLNVNESTPLDALATVTSRRSQFYYKKVPEGFDSDSFKFPIPLMHFEEDITDVKIKDVDALKPDNLLKCYIDKLAEMQEYKFLMNYVFNVKSFSTMASVYSYYGFPDSVGESNLERPNPSRATNKRWIPKIMEKTKKKCYRLFKKYYDVQGFNKQEATDPKHSDSLRSLSSPSLNLNLKTNIRWWQRRRFYERPYDEEGRECADGALAAFDQNESKPPRTDNNDYTSSTVSPEESPVPKIDPTPKEVDKELQEIFLEQSENNQFTIPNYDEELLDEDDRVDTSEIQRIKNITRNL